MFDFFCKIWTFLLQVTAAIVDGVAELVKTIVEALGDILSEIWDVTEDLLSSIWDSSLGKVLLFGGLLLGAALLLPALGGSRDRDR